MSIEQEKMIVESLSSIYPMQKFEEDAIETVLDALPRWIPCSERLPKDNRQVLVYARSVHYALAKYDEMRNADGTYKKQWVTFDAWKPLYTIKEVIAWMPLPEPFKGGDGMSRCKSCGAEIRWIKMTSGKSMPVDADPVTYWARLGAAGKVITQNGEVYSCNFDGDPSKATGKGYISHFSTCPYADRHRR